MNARGPLVLLALVVLASDSSSSDGSEPELRQPTLGPPDPDPVHPPAVEPGAPTSGPKTFAYDPSPGVAPAASEWTEVPPGAGYSIRRPRNAWGTSSAVSSLVGALERYGDHDLQVAILDMSRKGGGPLKPHKSHQFGRDVDLSFRGEAANWLPLEPTARLLQALLLDSNVGAIFLDWEAQKRIWTALSLDPDLALGVEPELQYPLARGTGRTRIRHWPGHSSHIHVRFKA